MAENNDKCEKPQACCAKGAQRQLLGGLSDDVKPADEMVQQLVDSFKDEIEQRTNQKYKTLDAISYKTQVVAGLNYFIKVSKLWSNLNRNIIN